MARIYTFFTIVGIQKVTIMRYELISLIPILLLVSFIGGHQNRPTLDQIFYVKDWPKRNMPHDSLHARVSSHSVADFSSRCFSLFYVIWSLECNSCPQITLPVVQEVHCGQDFSTLASTTNSSCQVPAPPGVTVADIKPLRHRKTLTLASRLWKLQVYLLDINCDYFDLSSLRMDLHGRALLLLLSSLSAFGGNVTEDGSLDKIGKVLFPRWHNN